MQKFILILLCIVGLRSGAETGIVGTKFRYISTFQVVNSSHIGFPSVVRLQNDSLMVVYRRGIEHSDVSGRIMRIYGSPNGMYWTSPSVLINQSGIDERDPSLTMLNDGRIMLSYYTHVHGNNAVYPPIPALCSIHVCFSSDSGKNFSTPSPIEGSVLTALPSGSIFTGSSYTLFNGTPFQSFAATSRAIEFKNRLIIPAYGGDVVVHGSFPGTVVSAPHKLYFFESLDEGLTWSRRLIDSTFLPSIWKAEPALVALPDGRFVMHYRCADNTSMPGIPGPMRQAFFDDELESFLPDQDFGFVGQGTDLIRLNCGVLVSGFRHVNPIAGSADVCMIYSIDEGSSWSDTICVFQGTSDCGYPSFIEISPNKLLVVYYTSGGSSIKAAVYDIDVVLQETNKDIEGINYSSFKQMEPFTMSMYPNPCRDFVTINLNSSSHGHFVWSISDASGRIIRTDQIELVSGQQSFELNVEGMPAGNYFISISGNETTLVRKLVVVD